MITRGVFREVYCNKCRKLLPFTHFDTLEGKKSAKFRETICIKCATKKRKENSK